MKFRLFAALLAMPVLLTLSAGALAQASFELRRLVGDLDHPEYGFHRSVRA